LKSIGQLYVKTKARISKAGEKRVTVFVSNNWSLLDFEKTKDGIFKLNDAQAVVIQYLVNKKLPATSEELAVEIAKHGISSKVSKHGKPDIANIFKKGTRSRKLLKFTKQKSGIYSLSDLWGENPKIKIKNLQIRADKSRSK